MSYICPHPFLNNTDKVALGFTMVKQFNIGYYREQILSWFFSPQMDITYREFLIYSISGMVNQDVSRMILISPLE